MNPSSSSSSSASSSSSLITRKRGSTCSDDETEQPNCKRLKSLKNDVFINYSFEEIGNGFISHLKRSLIRHGFFTSDHKDLQVGQDVCSELLKTIEESEIYVVVFSPGYASSLRSLDELVDIMKCRGERTVYPVFYKVEPTEVRNQQGSFKKVFQDYEADGEVDPERVRKWKQDLKDVCELAGSTLKNDRDEGTFVLEIVEKLWEMQKSQDLHVTDYPVGIRSRVEELVSLLRLDCDGVLVSSVSGFSGIGKTTIVKAMYNEIASKFNASCFLEDIHRRYNGRGDWKLKLQKDLISQITNDDDKVKLRRDGVEKIKKLLGCRKTLLVLDDVQKFEQLEGLGINSLRFFYKGSRIIVTTRDVDSLGGIPHTSYHTRLLNERESRKLFIRLMFARDEPVHTKFVEEVVARAGGLPLVLKVWSRHFTQYKEHLPAALKTLKQIPHDDVQKQLQMSYDSLSAESKNLFLDIACFFDGMKKNLVFKVLNDEDSCVDYEIEKLAHKFLVENKRYLSLPYVIKNMGHEVVRQEHPKEPGQRTRLMGYRDVVRVFREYSGTDSVRSIKLDFSQMEEGETLQLEAFKKMSSLRFIKIYDSLYKMITLRWSSTNDDMSACFSFKRLKYLEWVGFPCKSLDNIDMGNVVVIILHKSKLEKLWEGVKNFKKLKVLDVSDSSSLTKTGNFIGLENLEKLVLKGCYNLEELDSSISCLHQLTSLTLSNCASLKSIPDLPLNIQYVDADGYINISYNTEEPTNKLQFLSYNCSELQFLTELRLNNCSKLGSEGFTQVTTLRNLQTLYMSNCNISQVSSGIGNLVSLERLDLSGNTFSSLPESFSNLSQLERLDIDDCSELQLLPPLPSQLTKIVAERCGSLDVMPFDSMQNAYIFPSKIFKESRLMSNERLRIGLSGKELPEWCTYRDSGNVISFVAPIQFDHSKICGLILCATRVMHDRNWVIPVIYNKTKGTSHRIRDFEGVWGSMKVMFYPLNDTTIVVEAGDTLEVEFTEDSVKSGGLRLVYENDVVDSGLVLKDVRKPTLSLFPLSSESEIMTGNSITELNDEDVCSFPIQDEEYTYSDFSPMVS